MEKISRYLKSVELDGKVIIFNSLSGALIEVTHKDYLDLQNYKNNIASLCKSNIELYDALKKTRSVVDESVDEVDLVRYRNKRDIFLNRSFHLTINTTMDCNFKCWYCYEKCIPRSSISSELKVAIIKFIEKKIENNEISGVNLNWFGGEPLMNFKNTIYPISISIKKLCDSHNLFFTNAITTNGYLIDKKMVELFNEISLNSYHITLDGNESEHNKTRILKSGHPTYRKIIQNINMICEQVKNCSVLLRINYKNDAIEGIKDIASDFIVKNRSKIKISFHRIWQTIDKDEAKVDVKNLKDWFKDNGFKSGVTSYYNLFRGNTCYASRHNQVVINYDGNIFKCTAQEFNAENRMGHLDVDGEIIWISEKIIPWFANASFENQVCLNCELFGLCTGLCPEKYTAYKKSKKLEQYLRKKCPIKKDGDFSLNDYIISKYEDLVKGAII